MLHLGTQFPKESPNVPQNGVPMCKRQRTCPIAAGVPQIPARTTPATATPQNFKTHLCAKFRLGHCGYGNKCMFAHGIGEMRKPSYPVPIPVPVRVMGQDLNFGKMCRMYYMGKQCSYGDTCRFVHVDPQRNGCASGSGSGSSRPWIKRKLCNRWELTGSCHFGKMCLFAHGQAELDCHITLASGSIQINTSESVVRSKTGIWTSRNQQQVQGGKLDSKPESIQKLAGIYADWIEDKSHFSNAVKGVDI
ncbi:Zinc finger CCCH domain-containing protein 44 [Euphorbia peplus]|nr:Zinc finger CCCH domain-containing protein 44 [Euphorbia peplus]